MEAVIDTNIFIAALVKEDVAHEAAKELLEKLDIWLVPSLVVHEFFWFLKTNKLNASLIIPFIENSKFYILDTTKEDLLFSVQETLQKPQEYNDFVILSIALRNKKRLITFDMDLQKEFRKRALTE